MHYASILVAYDTSEHALRALTEALILAKSGLCKKLVITHVIDPYKSKDVAKNVAARCAGVVYAGSSKSPDDVTEMINKDIATLLSDLGLEQNRNFELDVAIEQGLAHEALCKLAQEFNAGLIVVGSRGLGALTSSMLGSVSYAVLREAHVPVLVVK